MSALLSFIVYDILILNKMLPPIIKPAFFLSTSTNNIALHTAQYITVN